ncbi:hypothetical protein SAMN05216188_11542 [Lentzea xinjiangensis]|uniref:Uncharacterized protein n=2 Tax=Lentzea xinjiangensis TaxID=402600 RepID=A0A1H9RTA1_9PSEU|nr:hypothetical protein SAMN05216188_11542 [Lentzea xinjiangensis]
MIIWGDDLDSPRSPHWAGLHDHWFRPCRADAILLVNGMVEDLIDWPNWADATSICDTFFLTCVEAEEGAGLEYVYGGRKRRIVSVDIKLPAEVVRATSIAKVVGTLVESALAAIEFAATRLSIPSPPLDALPRGESLLGGNRVSALRDILMPNNVLLVPVGPPRDRRLLKEKLVLELGGTDHDVNGYPGVLCALPPKVRMSADVEVDVGDFIASPVLIEQLALPEPVELVAFLSGADFDHRATRLAQAARTRRVLAERVKMRLIATGRDNSVVWMTFCGDELRFDVEDFVGPGSR